MMLHIDRRPCRRYPLTGYGTLAAIAAMLIILSAAALITFFACALTALAQAADAGATVPPEPVRTHTANAPRRLPISAEVAAFLESAEIIEE